MKIAQMTWFHHHNYGTSLQLYALNKYLSDLGHSVSVIDYVSESINDNVFLPDKIGFDYYKQKINSKLYRMGHHIYETEERAEKFNSFVSKLNFTKKCVVHSDFVGLNDNYDAFVCGSDQIWSPINFNPRYYLDFVCDTRKMIAYAPSFGTNRIKDPLVEESIGRLVSRFKNISIREKQGVEIAQSHTSVKVWNCVDPTLLLEQASWSQVGSDDSDSDYVLCYFLGGNNRFYLEAERIAKYLGVSIKLIPVFYEDFKRQGTIKEPIGPEEFVSLVRNARYVCTDSFHGTVFSIIFHKQFTVFERFKKNSVKNQNSRIYALLDQLDINDRLFGKKNYQPENPIDYSVVDKKKTVWVEQSQEFLEKSLQQCATACDFSRKNVSSFGQLCTGCGACQLTCNKNAIDIVWDINGFKHAKVSDSDCVQCSKCIRICPMINKTNEQGLIGSNIYSLKAKDKNILQYSSSGGAGYLIGNYLLNKGFDVVGCSYNIDKSLAEHILIRHDSTDDLRLIQGSKYLQSDFANIYKELDHDSNPLVVFGTPCQVAGIRSYMRLFNPTRKVVCVDLICHGVPSINAWNKYRKMLVDEKCIEHDKVDVKFRYKDKGWHSKYALIRCEDSCICEHQDSNMFFRLFETCNAFSESCYECKWRVETCADLRIGDYWGSRYSDDNEGVSMVMTFSDEGERIVRALIDTSIANVEKTSVEDYITFQQTRNIQKPSYYDSLMRDLVDDSITMREIDRKYVTPYYEIKKFHNKMNKLKDFLKHAR